MCVWFNISNVHRTLELMQKINSNTLLFFFKLLRGFRGAKKFSSSKQAMDFAFEMNDGSTEFGIQTIKYPEISFKRFEYILMERFR